MATVAGTESRTTCSSRWRADDGRHQQARIHTRSWRKTRVIAGVPGKHGAQLARIRIYLSCRHRPGKLSNWFHGPAFQERPAELPPPPASPPLFHACSVRKPIPARLLMIDEKAIGISSPTIPRGCVTRKIWARVCAQTPRSNPVHAYNVARLRFTRHDVHSGQSNKRVRHMIGVWERLHR